MRQIIARGLAGLGLGLGFVVLQFVVLQAAKQVFPDRAVQPMQSIGLAFSILNAPAHFLFVLWTQILRLPPHGDAGFSVIIGSIVAQWALIGLFGGLLWGWRSATSTSDKRKRAWPVVVIAGGAMFLSGFVASVFGHIFADPARFDFPTSAPSSRNSTELPHAEKALNDAMDAVMARPDDPKARCELAVAMAQEGRTEAAMDHLRKAVDLKPDYAEAYYQMGLCLARKERFDEAITFYEKALEIKPGFAEARQALEEATTMKQVHKLMYNPDK
jgi:hypothetical protein